MRSKRDFSNLRAYQRPCSRPWTVQCKAYMLAGAQAKRRSRVCQCVGARGGVVWRERADGGPAGMIMERGQSWGGRVQA